MRTVLLSFWRTDAAREFDDRVAHLLQKSTRDVRFVWVVGDSQDDTEAKLRAVAAAFRHVTVLRHDTGIVGEGQTIRLRRFSITADAGLDAIEADDERVLIHESDLRSPRDVVARLAGGTHEAVAGWPTLTIGGRTQLYDVFVYRARGRNFDAHPPYHEVYHPSRRFEVDSVGSVWSLPAWAIRAGVRGGETGALGICAGLRQKSVRILVDPTVEVVQPVNLWQPAVIGSGPDAKWSPFLPMKNWRKQHA